MKTQQFDPGTTGGSRRRPGLLDLNTRGACIGAAIFIPLVLGLWSVMRGADGNWDLYNYHLYNAFAYLNNKLTTDFAPSGFQNYFNPVLDIPYYLGLLYLPPRVLAFAMGVLHGLNYLLIFGICRKVLPTLAPEDRYRVPLLLALAGCLTVNFLSGLGNTMGDNATSLFCLASLLLVLQHHDRAPTSSLASIGMLGAAGVLMGMGTGLKLTNAVYAVALCAGLLSLPGSPLKRVTAAFLFGVGVLLGIGISAGHWFFVMWQTFGNPLFPQFSNIFPNPLASTIGVADNIWLPKNIWQQLLWPFLISLDAKRVGQASVHQIVWAIVYALFIVLCLKLLLQRRTGGGDGARLTWQARYVLVVVALGFFLWMKLFSIYRYLVPLELLAPLAVFIMTQRLMPYLSARKMATGLITAASLVVLLGGVKSWGHESWGQEGFHIELPPLADPARTTVLITEGHPWAWLAIGFPSSVAFTQIEGNFPKGPAFAQRIDDMVRHADGQTFALFQHHNDFGHEAALERSRRANRVLEALDLTNSAESCARLQWVIAKTRLKAELVPSDQANTPQGCRLQLFSDAEPDIAARNIAERETAQERLRPYGLTLVPDSCAGYRAGLSGGETMYQWCSVAPINRDRVANQQR